MANDAEKEAAARASLKYVRDGQVVGLGSGSTATWAIRLLGERVRAGMKIRGIPSSIASRDLAIQLGIPLTTFDEVQEIDVTIDGADEFDPALNLIKGGGGAMLREKIVASASKQLIIVTDSSKQVRGSGKLSSSGGSHRLRRTSGRQKDLRSRSPGGQANGFVR